MDLSQRSYSGRTFRPKPVIEEMKTSNALVVATSWGEPDHAQWVIEMIKEQLALNSNPESTRVGSYIPELNEDGNLLRSAVLHANEQLFIKENSREYRAAVEIAVVSYRNHVLSWAQVGTPHLILSGAQGSQPLASYPDWSWQLQQDAPLVSRALGLERICYPNCGSYRARGDEKVLLIARSAVPASIYTLSDASVNTCGQALVSDHVEAPYWLGVLDLSSKF